MRVRARSYDKFSWGGVCRRWLLTQTRARPLLAVGETPPRSAKPAALLGNVLISIQPGDLLPLSFREGIGQRTFRLFVTTAFARKDRNRRNPLCEIIASSALDQKHRACPGHAFRRSAAKALPRCHRENQSPAICETIKPALGWSRAAGIDIDDVSLVERHRSAVALHDIDICKGREMGLGPRSQLAIIFYPGNPASGAGKVSQNR